MTSWCHTYINLTTGCDVTKEDCLESKQVQARDKHNIKEIKMASWENIMNNHLTMGRGRWLCYAANAERRRRGSKELERRPGARPLVGRGVRPEPPRFLSWERPREENFHRFLARGRSRPILTPRPFLQIHHRYVPPCLPWGTAAGFGHMNPNIPCPPWVNNPWPHLPCPWPYVLPPPPSQDQESSTESSPSEPSETEEGDSLDANHGLP